MNPDQQDTPNPQPQEMPAATPTPAPILKSGKKLSKNVIIGALAGAIVLAGAISYGVYAYISNSPDNLLLSAVDNLKAKKSFGGTFKIVNGTEQNGVTFSGDVAAAADPSNNKNGEVILGLGTGNKRVAINALSLAGTLYLKATNTENLGPLLSSFSGGSESLSSPEFASALKVLNNQWFEIQQSDVKSLAQNTGSDNFSGAISSDDLKRVLDIYHQHPFIKSDKIYNDEVVDGSNSAHFSLKIDAKEQVAFLQAVKNANLSTIKVTDDDINRIKTDPGTNTDSIVEIWIARSSRQLKQLKVTNTKKGDESALTLTLVDSRPTFDKFEKPASSKPISELLTSLLGPSITANELNTTVQ